MTDQGKWLRVTGAARVELAESLREKYEAGVGIRDLARQSGRSYGFVRQVLADSGVTFRGRGGSSSGAARASRHPRESVSNCFSAPQSMFTVPELRDRYCVLRRWSLSDIQLVMEAGRDPVIPLSTTIPRLATAQDAQSYVERQWWYARTRTGYSFAVCTPTADGLVAVGFIGLWPLPFDTRRASVCLWVVERRRRSGIGTRALSTMADWAFSEMDIERLELFVDPHDAAAAKAAKQAGFFREALVHHAQRVGDERQDRLLYCRLRHEHALPRRRLGARMPS